MAQHDYVIANQGFPAFRSDLNNALAAIVSNNSGATEPTTMFAHQMWVDTAADPSILKIRNADNDAWITIGTINQTGDTFTLTSAISATTLNTSGAVVFNDAGADVDFRVEGDTNANLIFADASADFVGIGTNGPNNLLTVQADATGAFFGDNGVAQIIARGATDSTKRLGLGIDTTNNVGVIQATQVGVDTYPLALNPAGGNVGIGTSSPNAKLDVIGQISTSTNDGNSTVKEGFITTKHYTSSEENVLAVYPFSASTENGVAIGGGNSSYNAATRISFYTAANNTTVAGTERMRITSGGILAVGTSSPPAGSKLCVSESTNSSETGYFENTNASFSNVVLAVNATRNTTNGTYTFISCSISNVAQKFRVLDSGNVQNANDSYGPIASDQRLKQDIVDAASQWDDLKAIRIRKFHYRNDPNGHLQIGCIAQEAEQVSPGLVDRRPVTKEDVLVNPELGTLVDDLEKPITDEEGNITGYEQKVETDTEVLSFKSSILFWKATKALQEAMERIETLEAKVAALENA